MNARRTWFGLALGFLVLVALAPGLVTPMAGAQKARAEPRLRLQGRLLPVQPRRTPGRRRPRGAVRALLNDYARDGWEPVADLLNRSTVQTVGGGVTTRDSVSFVAFRRPR